MPEDKADQQAPPADRGKPRFDVGLALQCDNGAASASAAKGTCNTTTTVWEDAGTANNIDVVGFDIGNLPNNTNAFSSISTSAANGT